MNKYTPGPWKIQTRPVPNGYKFNIEVDLCLIATCYGSTNSMWDFVPGGRQGEANAQLIAAAPDLLEALVDVRDNVMNDSPDMWGRVDAAIAKATRGNHD